MKRFTDAVSRAIESQNWYAALAISLALPDICGRLEDPQRHSKERYVDWWNRFLLKSYSFEMGPEGTPHVFLGGEDCYALRCSFLHEGGDNIAEQKARIALDRFHFIEPRAGITLHCNQMNNTLQLQVDVFCRDILAGVTEWDHEVLENSAEAQERLRGLLTVQPWVQGGIRI